MGDKKTIVLVTGATGLLGRQVMSVLTEQLNLSVTGLSFSRDSDNLTRLDLTDFLSVTEFVTKLQPNIVVHTAAQRFPDKVEKDTSAAIKINVESSKHLAEVTKQVGGRLLYISTDYVFDGNNAPYSANSSPRPLNTYGDTKLAGEKAVLTADISNIVLRIPVLYGPVERLGESAVTVLLDLVKGGNAAKVSSYEVRCPAHTKDIAKIILDLITKVETEVKGGVYQWSGLEKLSKWDMVNIISRETGQDISHLVELAGPVEGVERPRDVELDRDELKQLGIWHHTDFKDGLMQALKPFL